MSSCKTPIMVSDGRILRFLMIFVEVAEFIWNWFPGLTGNEEHIWIGKTRDFWEKNTDRYLGRLWLRRGIQNLIPSRCFLFVCLLVHKSQCLQIYNII